MLKMNLINGGKNFINRMPKTLQIINLSNNGWIHLIETKINGRTSVQWLIELQSWAQFEVLRQFVSLFIFLFGTVFSLFFYPVSFSSVLKCAFFWREMLFFFTPSRRLRHLHCSGSDIIFWLFFNKNKYLVFLVQIFFVNYIQIFD